MRALLLLLAAPMVASIAWGPRPLPAEVPVAIIQNNDCASAQRDATVISEALGFFYAPVTCKYALGQAPLRGKTSPHMPIVPHLIGYSVADSRPFQPSGNFLTYEIPSEIPWVSAQATVVGYVKIDALLLEVQADNLIETAFALEDAGVSRKDITKEPFADQRLFVRVHPTTVARALKIVQAAKKTANASEGFVYRAIGFVKDCNGFVASLSALAVAEARTRAGVMAKAARTSLGAPLAVVDRGGGALNAVCGLGSDATVHQLAVATEGTGEVRSGALNLDAAFVHTISASWRLNLPANPLGVSWRSVSSTEWHSFGEWTNFLADGRRSIGVSGFSKGVAANRVRILVPDWAERPLQASPYAADLTYIRFGLNPFRPALILKAPNPAVLTAQVTRLRNYISGLPQRSSRGADLEIVYGRDDCRPYVYGALYDATTKAIASLHGTRIRYLQQGTAQTGGPVSCTAEPTTDDWTGSEAGQFGWSIASVAVGY